MILYSGDTIKTNGDDIAEALYLMGVKPVWLNNGDRVIGLEAIPYEEPVSYTHLNRKWKFYIDNYVCISYYIGDKLNKND